MRILTSLFLLGLSFGSGPCLANCGPLLISYVAGTKKNILKTIFVYFLFSFSRIVVYIFLGLAVFLVGSLVTGNIMGEWSKYIAGIGAGFIILMGILVALGKRLSLSKLRLFSEYLIQRDTKSVILLGVITGILPCAPLLAVFSYVGLAARSCQESVLYMLFFGLGTFISPLILFMVLASGISKFLAKGNLRYLRIFNFFCGLIMVVLGIQLFRRYF